MAEQLSKAESDYLQEKVHSSGGYIKYLQKKYDNKKLGAVSDSEWKYFQHLKRKERVSRIKKGKPTLKDIRRLSILEQEETKKAKEYHKIRKIKLPKIKPERTLGQAPFRVEKYYRNRYLDVIKRMNKGEWSGFLRRKKSPPAGDKPLVKNLSAEDYLKYLRKKMGTLYKGKE